MPSGPFTAVILMGSISYSVTGAPVAGVAGVVGACAHPPTRAAPREAARTMRNGTVETKDLRRVVLTGMENSLSVYDNRSACQFPIAPSFPFRGPRGTGSCHLGACFSE